MQQSQIQKTPFSAFRLKSVDLGLLHTIPQAIYEQKTQALVEGSLRRNTLKLYKGNKSYYEDLQIVLDHDRQKAPSYFKNHNILVNRDGTNVLVQCIDCGKFNPVYKFCQKCQHIHYCSDGCQIRSKLAHQKQCRSRILPGIDQPLQVEIHLGSDLGHNIQIYFQHQMRMSLQLRGQKLMKAIYHYYNGQGKQFISQNFGIDIFNKHIRYRKLDQSKYINIDNGFCMDSLEKLVSLYKKNSFLNNIQLFLLKRGSILWKQIRQIHNNHIHLIFIFLCCD